MLAQLNSGSRCLRHRHCRCRRLSGSPNAFVRPSPARGTLGGVAQATSDAILICEAAGFGRVLVETVGVGQNETAVVGLVDCLLLVMPPVGGDELQVGGV